MDNFGGVSALEKCCGHHNHYLTFGGICDEAFIGVGKVINVIGVVYRLERARTEIIGRFNRKAILDQHISDQDRAFRLFRVGHGRAASVVDVRFMAQLAFVEKGFLGQVLS